MASPIPIDGEVLRDLRVLRLLSQEGLAREAGCTREEISAYERGVHRPTPAQLDRIVTALERNPVKAVQWLLIKTPALDVAMRKIEEPMNRRDMVKLLTAATATAAGGGAGAVLLGAGPLALGEVSLHQATQDLIDRWPTATPAESLAAARGLLNGQSQALKTKAMSSGERRQLLVDAIDTAILAGWSARFVESPAEQAAWFAHALKLSDEAGLDVVRGEVLASMAAMHKQAWGDGDALAVLQLTSTAAALVGTHGPVAAYVANLESEAHAALEGGEDDSLRALERALNTSEQGGRQGFCSSRGLFVDFVGDQAAWAGGRYAELGRADEALEHLKRAQSADSSAGSPRSSVLTAVLVAKAHAVAVQPEPMCHHANLALDGSLATGLDAGVGLVRSARGRLPDPCADVECVRELDERLATL